MIIHKIQRAELRNSQPKKFPTKRLNPVARTRAGAKTYRRGALAVSNKATNPVAGTLQIVEIFIFLQERFQQSDLTQSRGQVLGSALTKLRQCPG